MRAFGAGCWLHPREKIGALGSEASEWVREGRGHPHTGHMARECGCCGALGRVGGGHTGPRKVMLKPHTEELAVKPGC